MQCANCKRGYLKPLSKDAQYCDRLCQKEAERGVSPACIHCGSSVVLKDSHRWGNLRRFCSLACIWTKQNGKLPKVRGKLARKSPIKKPKGDHLLSRWSLAVKERAGSRCELPGCTAPEGDVESHHIRGKGAFPEAKYKYDVDNGIGLCNFHHRWAEEHPENASRLGLKVRRKDAA